MAYKLFVNGNTLPASDLNNAFGTSGWTPFTPTISSGSLTVGVGGSLLGWYIQVGKTVHWRITATFGSSGRALNDPKIAVPVTQSAAYATYNWVGSVSARIGGSSYGGTCQFESGNIRPLASAGTALTAFTTSSPGTLASGDSISLAGFYEAA